MSRHSVSWENLIDWLDGRLEPQAAQELGEHLATGCPGCQADLAWLRRFEAATRAEVVEPPGEVVGRVKAGYRTRRARLGQARRRLWPSRLPRLAPALGALLLLVAAIAYLFWTPAAFARQAVLTMAEGTVEAASSATGGWEVVTPKGQLREGERVRAVDGGAIVALFDGSQLQLQPGAELTLASLRSGLLGGVYRVAIYQTAGTVRYDVPALPSARSTFRVQSPAALISVEGTTFVVVVDSASQTRVTVLAGSVSATGAVDRVLLGQSQAAVIRARARIRLVPTFAPGAGPIAPPAHAPAGGRPPAEKPGPWATQGRPPGSAPRQTRRAGPAGISQASATPSATPAAGTIPSPGLPRNPGPTVTSQAPATPPPTQSRGWAATSTPTGSPGPNVTPVRWP